VNTTAVVYSDHTHSISTCFSDDLRPLWR